MLHRAVLEISPRHAGHDAAHVVHLGLIRLHGDSHVAAAAEDDAAVAVFLGAAGAAARVAGLRHILVDDAIELFFDEQMVVTVEPNGVRQTAAGCPKGAREGRRERINTMFTPCFTKS